MGLYVIPPGACAEPKSGTSDLGTGLVQRARQEIKGQKDIWERNPRSGTAPHTGPHQRFTDQPGVL